MLPLMKKASAASKTPCAMYSTRCTTSRATNRSKMVQPQAAGRDREAQDAPCLQVVKVMCACPMPRRPCHQRLSLCSAGQSPTMQCGVCSMRHSPQLKAQHTPEACKENLVSLRQDLPNLARHGVMSEQVHVHLCICMYMCVLELQASQSVCTLFSWPLRLLYVTCSGYAMFSGRQTVGLRPTVKGLL